MSIVNDPGTREHARGAGHRRGGAGPAGRGQRQHPGHDRHDHRDHPGRDDRRDRPRHAGHDPQGVRLDLRLVLGGRPGRERAGLLDGVGPGRRRVPAADAHGAVPRRGGPQRPVLADSATWSTSPTSASCTTAAARRWPAAPGSRRRSPCPMLRDGQVVGTLDFFSTTAVEISPARLDALRIIGRTASDKLSAAGPAWATWPGSSRWSTTRRST